MDAIGDAFDSVGSAGGKGLGMVLDVAKTIGSDPIKYGSLPIYLAERGKNRNVSQPVMNAPGIRQGLGAIEKAYTYGVARPVSTAEQVTGASLFAMAPTAAVNLLSGQDRPSLSQAWKNSEKSSAGQVGTLNNLYAADRLLGRHDAGGLTYENAYRAGTRGDRNFDPKFSMASGAMDAALGWYADPLVVAGLGVKAARMSKTGLTAADKAAIAGEDVSRLSRAGQKRAVRVRNEFDRFIEETDGLSPSQLMQTEAFRNSSQGAALASLFGKADGDHDLKRLIWRTAVGDDTAKAALAERRADVAAQYDRLTADLDSLVFEREFTTAGGGGLFDHLNNADEIKALQDEVRASERVRDMLDRAVGTVDDESANAILDQQNIGVFGSVAERARITKKDRARISQSASYTVQDGVGGVPVRVLRSPKDRRPEGWVDLHDAEQGFSEMETMLKRVRGLDPTLRQRMLDDFINAQDDNARALTIQGVESKVFRHIGDQLGYTREEIERLLVKVRAERSLAVNTYKERAYAAATDAEGVPVDMLRLEDGTLVHRPLSETQLDNAMPTLDVDHIYRVLKQNSSRMGALRAGGSKAWFEAEHGLDIFNDLWKLSVLLRGGYLVRNVIDSQIRILAHLGGMEYAVSQLANVGQGVKRKWSAVDAMALRGSQETRLAAARAELAEKLAGKPIKSEGTVRLYRGSHEPIDPTRIPDEGMRWTTQRDYAEQYGGDKFLYEIDVPESMMMRSEISDAFGDGPLPHTYLDRETSTQGRLIRAPKMSDEGLDPEVLRHVTSDPAAAAITREGFRPGNNGLGKEWGEGVYLSKGDEAHGYWAFEFDTWQSGRGRSAEGRTTVHARIRGKKMQYEAVSNAGRPVSPRRFLEKEHRNLLDSFDQKVAGGLTENQALSVVAREAGYDAIVIGRQSGDEVVVFNPDNVVPTSKAGEPLRSSHEVVPERPVLNGEATVNRSADDPEIAALYDEIEALETSIRQGVDPDTLAPHFGQGEFTVGGGALPERARVVETEIPVRSFEQDGLEMSVSRIAPDGSQGERGFWQIEARDADGNNVGLFQFTRTDVGIIGGDIFVPKGLRGKGYGRALNRAAEKVADSINARLYRAEIVNDAHRANLLKNGYQETPPILDLRDVDGTPIPYADADSRWAVRSTGARGGYRVGDAFGRTSAEYDINRARITSQESYLSLAVGENSRLLNGMRGSGDWRIVGGSDPGYTDAYLRVVNRHFRQSEITMRLLQGESPQQVARWLRSSEGRNLRRRLVHRGDTPEQLVEASWQNLNHVIPDAEMRAVLAERPLQPGDLDLMFPSAAARPAINAEQIAFSMGHGPVAERLDKIRNGWFRVMNSLPDDVLGRHPMYRQLYRGRVKQLLTNADPSMSGRISAADQRVLEEQARIWSRREMKRYMFDVSSKSNLAHWMRFVSPFFSAWEDTMVKYGRLVVRDPSIIPRAWQAWTAPNDSALFEVVDADGNPVESKDSKISDDEFIRIHAGFLGERFSQGIMDIPKSGFNVVLQGDPWWLPGFGPMVQAPVNEVAKGRPELEDSVRFILPYGTSESSLRAFLPTAAKAATTGEDDRSYARIMVQIMQTEKMRFAQGLREDKPTAKEIKKRTDAYWKLRTFTALTSPAAIQYKSPYQFYIDEAHRYQEKYGFDADQKYLEDYGQDYFLFTTSLSKNRTGIRSSQRADAAARKVQDLISEHPDYGWFFVGPDNTGEFSRNVYTAQNVRKISPTSNETWRGSYTPEEAIAKNNAELGWIEYQKLTARLEAVRIARGLPSMAVKGAEDLRAIKSAWMDRVTDRKNGPAWGRDWQNDYEARDSGTVRKFLEAARVATTDKRIADRKDIRTMATYLKARDAFRQVLAQRDAMGGSDNLTAQSNADLAQVWSQITGRLVDYDVTFGDVFARTLENDDLMSAA